MSVQTSYATRLDQATPGLLADLNPRLDQSKACESTSIAFGIIVQRGTDPEKQCLVGGNANVSDVLGISVRTLGLEAPTVNAVTLEYLEGNAVQIMEDGKIFATCVNGATAGDPVKFVNADGTLGSGTPAVGETSITGSRWETSVAPGGVGLLTLHINALVAGV